MAFTQLTFAQAKDTELKKQTIEVIKASGSATMSAIVKQQILPMIAPDKQAAFLVEFESTLPALYDKMADVYLEVYNKEDIAAMKAFYDSPIGKKITANSGTITEKSQAASMKWAEGLQSIMMKYMN